MDEEPEVSLVMAECHQVGPLTCCHVTIEGKPYTARAAGAAEAIEKALRIAYKDTLVHIEYVTPVGSYKLGGEGKLN